MSWWQRRMKDPPVTNKTTSHMPKTIFRTILFLLRWGSPNRPLKCVVGFATADSGTKGEKIEKCFLKKKSESLLIPDSRCRTIQAKMFFVKNYKIFHQPHHSPQASSASAQSSSSLSKPTAIIVIISLIHRANEQRCSLAFCAP